MIIRVPLAAFAPSTLVPCTFAPPCPSLEPGALGHCTIEGGWCKGNSPLPSQSLQSPAKIAKICDIIAYFFAPLCTLLHPFASAITCSVCAICHDLLPSHHLFLSYPPLFHSDVISYSISYLRYISYSSLLIYSPFTWGVLRVFSSDFPCKVCMPLLYYISSNNFGFPLQVSELSTRS